MGSDCTVFSTSSTALASLLSHCCCCCGGGGCNKCLCTYCGCCCWWWYGGRAWNAWWFWFRLGFWFWFGFWLRFGLKPPRTSPIPGGYLALLLLLWFISPIQNPKNFTKNSNLNYRKNLQIDTKTTPLGGNQVSYRKKGLGFGFVQGNENWSGNVRRFEQI